MGSRQSILSEEEIQNYLVRSHLIQHTELIFFLQDTTFLSRTEVLRVVNRFIELSPDIKKCERRCSLFD